MKVKIVERHAGSSDTLRNYVLEKTNNLERYFDRIVSVDVVLAVEKERHVADMHAHLVNRKVLTAREESPDMYTSIDRAIDKLKRQLVKYKDQLTDVKDKGDRNAAAADVDTDHREIVRTDTYFPKPMTPEEAALQLDAIDKDFLVFINAETDEVNIIYHRHDGNYGLIEPRR